MALELWVRQVIGRGPVARRLIEIASTVEPIQDGRVHIEKIDKPFLLQDHARSQVRGRH